MNIKSFLIIALLLVGLTSPVYAENEKKFTLTTYYPAPYGDYKQLKATGSDTSNETIALEARGSSGTGLVVTDANNVGIGTSAPAAKLDIVGNGSTIIVPRKSNAGDPATGVNGMIYYNSNTNKFRAYENGAWKDLIGGGNSQCKTGSYSGSGKDAWKTIDVGFNPDFVYITGYEGGGDCSRDCVKTNTMPGNFAKKIYITDYDENRTIALTSSGFKISKYMNCPGYPYFYVALKSNS